MIDGGTFRFEHLLAAPVGALESTVSLFRDAIVQWQAARIAQHCLSIVLREGSVSFAFPQLYGTLNAIIDATRFTFVRDFAQAAAARRAVAFGWRQIIDWKFLDGSQMGSQHFNGWPQAGDGGCGRFNVQLDRKWMVGKSDFAFFDDGLYSFC